MSVIKMADGRELSVSDYIKYLKDNGRYHQVYGSVPNNEWREGLNHVLESQNESGEIYD